MIEISLLDATGRRTSYGPARSGLPFEQPVAKGVIVGIAGNTAVLGREIAVY
jgi:hypothetical protein